MSASTVPTVKASLKALFAAAVDPTTEVWAPRPNEDHQDAENVYIVGARGQRKFITVAANNPLRSEEYELDVEVEVYRQGTDTEGAETRLWEIVNVVEAAVAASPKLGVTGTSVQWGLAARFDESCETDDNGVLAKYVFGVSVTARI